MAEDQREENTPPRYLAIQHEDAEWQRAAAISHQSPHAHLVNASSPTAEEIRETLLRSGLARKSRQKLSTDATTLVPRETSLPTLHSCLVNKLPTELRQRIFLFLLDAPASELETWEAPFFGGIGRPERLITIPCKVDWWLAIRRFLTLSQTCTRWRTELGFVARIQSERAIRHRDDLMTTLIHPGLKRLREKTPTPQYARLLSYLKEFRKSEDGSLLQVLTRVELRISLWSTVCHQVPYSAILTTSCCPWPDNTHIGSPPLDWESTLRSLHRTAITHHKRAEDHGNDLYENCKSQCWKYYVSCGEGELPDSDDGLPEYTMDTS